jgi:hypothetical protein
LSLTNWSSGTEAASASTPSGALEYKALLKEQAGNCRLNDPVPVHLKACTPAPHQHSNLKVD